MFFIHFLVLTEFHAFIVNFGANFELQFLNDDSGEEFKFEIYKICLCWSYSSGQKYRNDHSIWHNIFGQNQLKQLLVILTFIIYHY
jgi:hypothetical protein